MLLKKTDLYKSIYEKLAFTGLNQKQMTQLINFIIDSMKKFLIRYRYINIKGFGVINMSLMPKMSAVSVKKGIRYYFKAKVKLSPDFLFKQYLLNYDAKSYIADNFLKKVKLNIERGGACWVNDYKRKKTVNILYPKITIKGLQYKNKNEFKTIPLFYTRAAGIKREIIKFEELKKVLELKKELKKQKEAFLREKYGDKYYGDKRRKRGAKGNFKKEDRGDNQNTGN